MSSLQLVTRAALSPLRVPRQSSPPRLTAFRMPSLLIRLPLTLESTRQRAEISLRYAMHLLRRSQVKRGKGAKLEMWADLGVSCLMERGCCGGRGFLSGSCEAPRHICTHVIGNSHVTCLLLVTDHWYRYTERRDPNNLYRPSTVRRQITIPTQIFLCV